MRSDATIQLHAGDVGTHTAEQLKSMYTDGAGLSYLTLTVSEQAEK